MEKQPKMVEELVEEQSEPVQSATVTFWNKSGLYGFLASDNPGPAIFFHSNDTVREDNVRYVHIKVGTRVSYQLKKESQTEAESVCHLDGSAFSETSFPDLNHEEMIRLQCHLRSASKSLSNTNVKLVDFAVKQLTQKLAILKEESDGSSFGREALTRNIRTCEETLNNLECAKSQLVLMDHFSMYTALKLETTALSFRSKQRTLVQEMHDKFVEVGLTVSCTFFVHVIFEKYRMECADLSSIDAPTDLVMAEIPDIDAIERRKWNYMAGWLVHTIQRDYGDEATFQKLVMSWIDCVVARNSDRYYSKSRVTMVSPQFQYFFDTMEILIQILLSAENLIGENIWIFVQRNLVENQSFQVLWLNLQEGLPRIPSSASSRLMSALVEQYMKSRSRTHVSSTRRNLSVKSTLRGGLLSLTGERVKKNVRTHISAAEMVTFGESKPNLARSMLKALVLLHGQEEALNMLVAELTLQRLKAFLIVAFPGAIIAKAKPSKLALAEEILRCSSRYELVETSSE